MEEWLTNCGMIGKQPQMMPVVISASLWLLLFFGLSSDEGQRCKWEGVTYVHNNTAVILYASSSEVISLTVK